MLWATTGNRHESDALPFVMMGSGVRIPLAAPFRLSAEAAPQSGRQLASVADLALHNSLVELLVNDLDRSAHFVVVRAELFRNHFHQHVDPLDKRGSGSDCTRSR
jgi:hypothetical protein